MANLIAGVLRQRDLDGWAYSAAVCEGDPETITHVNYDKLRRQAGFWFRGNNGHVRARMLAFLLAEEHRASSPGGLIQVHNLYEHVPDPDPTSTQS